MPRIDLVRRQVGDRPEGGRQIEVELDPRAQVAEVWSRCAPGSVAHRHQLSRLAVRGGPRSWRVRSPQAFRHERDGCRHPCRRSTSDVHRGSPAGRAATRRPAVPRRAGRGRAARPSAGVSVTDTSKSTSTRSTKAISSPPSQRVMALMAPSWASSQSSRCAVVTSSAGSPAAASWSATASTCSSTGGDGSSADDHLAAAAGRPARSRCTRGAAGRSAARGSGSDDPPRPCPPSYRRGH